MITLAIPNRNGSQFLAQTLRSIVTNRPHVRFWFQDGLSTDASLDIAKYYCGHDDRIVSEPDRSQADALNCALARMGGDVIGFLNSDDILAEGAAEAVLAAFEEDPELDLVYGEVEWIDADGKVTGHHQGDISTVEEILNIYNVWWKQRQWVQPEVFWRRRLWEKVGPFDTRYDLAFDYDYWVRCFLAGAKVRRLPLVVSRFRLHSNQKSTRSEQAASEIRQIVSEALRKGIPISTSCRIRLRNHISYDEYWLSSSRQQAPFARALLANPFWLLTPPVQKRLWDSVRYRICRKRI